MKEVSVHRRTNKVLISAALVAVIILFATGCEKHEKYRMLSFFFDGVPPLEEETKGETAGEIKGKPAAKKRSQKSKVFIHGPKAAGECFHCHNTASTMSFGKSGKNTGGMPQLGQITPGRLVAPVNELCIECHTSKSAELRQAEHLWVHGPLSDGNCIVCHDYHETPYQYMLFRESSIELCSQCHAKGFIKETDQHKSGEECISCHNPHVGANRYLLRKDFDERF